MEDLIKKGMIELIEIVPIKQPKKIFWNRVTLVPVSR